jgi:diguanylate cyclase (GGDEF)-like protein/PAS domain S-box-containing protein
MEHGRVGDLEESLLKSHCPPVDGEDVTLRSTTLIDPSTVLAALPMGLAVVDARGTVLSANELLARMIGCGIEDLVGRSLMDFAYVDDLDFAQAILAEGTGFGHDLLGPVRVRFVDTDGVVRSTEFWARNCLSVPGIEGYVVTVLEASITEKLSDAVRSIASNDPLEDVLAHLSGAMTTNPVLGVASVLVAVGDSAVAIGDWPLPRRVFSRSEPATEPWMHALDRAEPCDIGSLDDMDSAWRPTVAAAGFEAVWARPIVTTDNTVTAVLVVWRHEAGSPSANQRRRLDDAVAIAALAFDQRAHRGALERAAFTDPLTGLGNRNRLAQLLADPFDQVAGVLYVDLDRFKLVNDRYGHRVGDEILSLVGKRLAGVVRKGDDAIRIGGDEFVLLCRRPVDHGVLTVIAERIARVLSEPFALPETAEREPLRVQIGASVGITVGNADHPLMDRIAEADRAMYQVKPHIVSGATDIVG